MSKGRGVGVGSASARAAVAAPPSHRLALSEASQYTLHGVVCHSGVTPFSGHYVADVRHDKVVGG